MNVVPGRIVVTDGWPSADPPRAMGYRPRTQGNPKQAKTALPQRHRVFGNRNPWLRGTHQRVGHQHL